MRPIIALATLAATATYVAAQNYGPREGNAVGQSPPAPGDKPTHDPSSGFAGFVAQGAVPRRNCPPSAHDPYPAQGIPQGAPAQGRGRVEILPHEQFDQMSQQAFRPDVPDFCMVASDIQKAPAPWWTEKGKSLADTLTLDRRGRVWWDYAREIDSVTSRLLNVGKTTLLVPIDSAIMKLPRKPHQNEEGETSDEDAQTNVDRFIAAHIIPDFNEHKTDGPIKNLLNQDIEIVADEARGAFIVKPGNYEVVELSEASNGRILYINGVLPFRE